MLHYDLFGAAYACAVRCAVPMAALMAFILISSVAFMESKAPLAPVTMPKHAIWSAVPSEMTTTLPVEISK